MERADELDANRAVIVRFNEELCDKWRLDLLDDTLSERIRFRASLGSIVKGRDEFKRYLIGSLLGRETTRETGSPRKVTRGDELRRATPSKCVDRPIRGDSLLEGGELATRIPVLICPGAQKFYADGHGRRSQGAAVCL